MATEDFKDDEDINPGEEVPICRVCRLPTAEGRPLFHPCVCTGTIRYVHQDCLLQWLKHSGKNRCELCHHSFKFTPIYREDTPSRLSFKEVISGLLNSTVTRFKHWAHLGLVLFMWLIIVPLFIARIYYFLIYNSLWSIYLLPVHLLSISNCFFDVISGIAILAITIVVFISLVWLKDQIVKGGNPRWLADDHQELNQRRRQAFDNHLDQLDQELAEIGREATIRRNHPTRVAIGRRQEELSAKIEANAKRFEEMAQRLHTHDINDLWLMEMELIHQLRVRSPRLELAVQGAKERMAQWYKSNPNGDTSKIPKVSLEKQWYSSEGSIDQMDVKLLNITNISPPVLSSTEKANLQDKLVKVREKMEEAQIRHKELTKQALKAMDVRDQKTDENLPLEKFHPQEQAIIIKVRDLKRQLMEVRQEEEDFIKWQQRRADMERRLRRLRDQRWIRRWLNDEDEFGLPRRRRNRPNLGAALAGLAIENAPQEADPRAELEPVDEITWARLLGLDGTFRFLEHVIWVVCMVALVIFLFVYLPHQLGYLFSKLTLTWNSYKDLPFSRVIAVFIGYLIFSVLTIVGYAAAKAAHIPRMKTLTGFAYVSLKVAMILSVEAGLFPLMCGWWMDICSYSLFGTVWKDRQSILYKIPGTMTFLHWLAGMVYIFYFASFVMLLREILRPGVLWFLRNLNDQNFHPIQEMISLPMSRQVRRFLMSSMMFGTSVLLVVWLPIRMIQKLAPAFLPYNLTLSSSIGPLREVQLELILLHVVLPTLLEYSNTKAVMLKLVKIWSSVSATLFDLHSYLLDRPQAGGRVVDMHGKLLYQLPAGRPQPGPVYGGNPQILGPGFAPYKPYLRPRFFHLKLFGFLTFTIVCLVLFSILVIFLPVYIGRVVLGIAGISSSPELYTGAIGFYTIWIAFRVILYISDYISLGLNGLQALLKNTFVIGLKCSLAGVLLFGIIPFLLGLLCDLIVFVPLRVPLDRSPVYFLSTDWALGLLHTKCVCGAVWLGNSPLKQNLDRMYRNGIRNMDLKFIAVKIALPVIIYLSMALSIPYIFAYGLVPWLTNFGMTFYLVNYIQRRIYPFLTCFFLLSAFCVLIVAQCHKVYTKIKDERYLIGQRLVNYTEGGLK